MDDDGQVIVPGRLPILQAPMAGGPSTPRLAAAVNAAGGLGSLATGYLSPDATSRALRATRDLTADPVAANVFVPSSNDDGAVAAAGRYGASLAAEAARLGVPLGTPRWDDDSYRAKLDILAGAAVAVVTFAFGCPAAADVRALQAAGSAVAVTVTDRDGALQAAGTRADALIVQGTEAGGHQGGAPSELPNRVGLHQLLRELRDVGLPMIATGGIATADDVVAALELGAVAVQVGTALLCTAEAGTSDVHRSALLQRRYADTMLTRAFSGRWARGLANRFAVEHPDAPTAYPHVHHLTRPLRAAAAERGDADVPNLWAGTAWREARAEPAAAAVARLAAQL
jgi:nitronate monooxygenase